MRPDFEVRQDKEIPLNNKILTLIFNDMLDALSTHCISRPGALPCSLSAVFFSQSSSQTPLPSSDKCWEMKSKNASEYPWRHGIVVANIFPCVCQTNATSQLFYQKYPLPRCSLRFLLPVTAVTIPTPLGAASLWLQKLKAFLPPSRIKRPSQPPSAGHVPIDRGQNCLLMTAVEFCKAELPGQASRELFAPSQLFTGLLFQITSDLTFPCLLYFHKSLPSAQISFLSAFKKTTDLSKSVASPASS